VFKKRIGRFPRVLISVILLILLVMYISLTNGSFDMTIGDIVRTLFRVNPDPDFTTVIFEYRLPRIVIALLVGFGLGIAGAVIQGVAKNGLADPGILGISSGAGAAIVVYIFFFQTSVVTDEWYSIFIRPLFGWIGGLAAALLIFVLSWKRGALDIQRFILIGIAISAGFGAISLYFSLKMDPDDFQKAAIWVHGSIYHATWVYIAAVLPWLACLTPIVLMKHGLLDLFQLDEVSIKGLGAAVNAERLVLVLCSVGLVSSCISVVGNIAFIGLIAPHIARQLVGLHHRFVLPVSGCMGMLLVLAADFIARNAAPTEIPVGIVAAVIGIPYLIYLLYRGRA
jgi:iron complex transport system permease protein